MSSAVFTRADMGVFARVLADSLSQEGLDTYQSRLGLTTTGTKDQRASQIVRHIFDGVDDTDGALLDLVNHLFLEDANAGFRVQREAYRVLHESVLAPRGVYATDDGYALTAAPAAARPGATPSADADTAVRATVEPAPSIARQGQVFIVHGRDLRPVEVLQQFLHFVGLGTMTWTDAVRLTGRSQPHTYDVVRAGIEAAVAVIVVFSPDDQARLDPRLQSAGDAPEPFTGQPRQNVLLEAGMAFAAVPSRTIFVRSEPVREISDIIGFNWVELDGAWGSREDLLNRLRLAGADAAPVHGNLLHRLAGPFRVEARKGS